MMRFMSLVLALGLGLLFSACSGPGNPRPAAASAPGDAAGSQLDAPEIILPPTSTPWPTFTPVPTATPTPVPPPTPTLVPTSTPWPRVSVVTPTPDPASVPGYAGPTGPAALVLGENFFLAKRGLIIFSGGDLPQYLMDRDWDNMPASVELVSSSTRYLLWVVAYDFAHAPPGAQIDGLVRWSNITPGLPPVVMFETPMTISHSAPFFYHGLGGDDPGTWSPGLYRVEFFDGSQELLVSSNFEVR